jgi:GT2 family glycosyltransferase/glycosyltransferase involved in cell wall biosynthesis
MTEEHPEQKATPSLSQALTGCTIVTPKTIPHAKVLASSFKRHHPGSRFFALLLDRNQPAESIEGIEWVSLSDLSLKPGDAAKLPLVCSPEEMARALKPALLRTLLAAQGGEVAYFDHEIKVFSSLDELAEKARKHSIVLFPIASTAAEVKTYDPALIVVGAGSEVFLDWWQHLSRTQSYKNPDALRETEQLSLDSVAALFPQYFTVNAPASNASYRNLPGREFAWTGSHYELEGEPLRLFHFAGYDPAKPHLLSEQQGADPLVLLSREPAVARLCEEYREELLRARGDRTRSEEGDIGSLPNGLKIDRHIRRIYREALAKSGAGEGVEPPNPFAAGDAAAFIAWLNEPVPAASYPVSRYLLAIHAARPDLRSTFPDPLGGDAAAFVAWFVHYGRYEENTGDALVPAAPPSPAPLPDSVPASPNEQINVAGYFRAELGIGEAARLLLQSLKAAGIPCRAIPYSTTASRQDHPFEKTPDSPITGDINLICVNADQLPLFAQQSGDLFLPGRYSIGVWFWEAADFPPEMYRAFNYVDEIWVASEFVRQTFSKVSPRPVFKFPLPIVAPEIDPSLSRTDLGLPERFTFLFSFDFLSVLERKNPVGLIQAFKRAFRPGEGPALLIKTINGDKRTLEMEKLRYAASDHPDIFIRDEYASALEKNTLMARCDCYVSLHRSEGFGLTLAEAMALGRPAIATGFSGNLEFMNAENSFLCSYRPRKIGPGAEPYPASSEWAEPNLDEAAAMMRRVYLHPDEAKQRSEKALSDIERLHSPAATGRIISEQLALIRQRRPFSQGLAAARLTRPSMTAPQLREVLANTERALSDSENERRELEQRMRTIHERLRAEARLAQTEAAALLARSEKAERATWDTKVRRAAATAQLRQRDRDLQQIQTSPIWKAVKPLWKFYRHLRGGKLKAEKFPRENLLFAIDAPATWTTSREIVVIRGWCFAGSGQALAGIRAKIGKKSHFARYGLARADLAALHPTFPEAAHAGFMIEIRGVPKGVSPVVLEAIIQGQDWQPLAEHELVRMTGSKTPSDGSDNGSSESLAGSDGDYTKASLTLYPGLRAPQLLRALEPLFKRHAERALGENPLFSIITPTHHTKLQWLAEAAASLLNQTFRAWEWCIVDDGSESDELREMLEKFTAFSAHVRVKFVPPGGISSANDHGLEMARGEYVGFLDHDDLLDSGALAAMAEKFSEGFDAVYSDEDKLNDTRGELVERFFKPDWSPEYFRGVMYVGHLLCVRREIATKIRFDSTFDGVQDFEFMLRVAETGAKIGHIPRILYHWRKTPGSVAETTDAKPRIAALQQQAVTNHLLRVGLPARAVPCAHPHRLKIVPAGRSVFPLVSVIIPTRDAPELLGRCLKSIFEKSSYPKMEVILMDNETTDDEALWLMGQYPVRRIHFPNPFNYSRANNLGARQAAGEFLVFLNNDTEIVAEDWLQQLLYYAEQPDVGAVGALLLYENRTVQHAGVVLGIRGTADHALRGFPCDADGYAGNLACAREVSAVTAACSMMRKSLFLEVGGFNEHFFTAYQDVDLCLRLGDRGLRIIYTPRAVVLHHEWASRKTYYDMVDRMLLLDRWERVIERGDPYYNPNLALESGDYSRRL